MDEIHNLEAPIFHALECLIFMPLMLNVFDHIIYLHGEVVQVYELLKDELPDMLIIELKKIYKVLGKRLEGQERLVLEAR